MLLCQLSDPHIRAPGQLAYRRVDTNAHFRRCITHVLSHEPRPDALVITGDLVDLGQPEEYHHLLSLLAPLTLPVYLIAGNHDDRGAMRTVLPPSMVGADPGFVQYVASVGEVRLVALDTLLPGEGGGTLCRVRLHWLENQLEDLRRHPVIVMMHHPPFRTGIDYMDRVGLQTHHALEPIVRRHRNIERILCGHLHRSITRRYGGTIAMTCPSPAHQVVLNLERGAPNEFAMEPPGYLLHHWTAEGGVVTHAVAIGDFAGPYPFYEEGHLVV